MDDTDKNSPENTQRKMEARLDYLRVEELIRETDVVTVIREALAKWEQTFAQGFTANNRDLLLDAAKRDIEALLGAYGHDTVTVHPFIEGDVLTFGFVMPPMVKELKGTWQVDL